jgi:hypothetical protein
VPALSHGKVFAAPATDLSKFASMNQTCPHCGVRLEPEPGFYQGAMYVSYAFTVALMVAISVILYFFGVRNEWVYIGTVVGVMILLVPVNYRASRIAYLYAFGGIKYEPK